MFPMKFPIPIPDPITIITVAKKLLSIFFDKDKKRENMKETISQKKATDIEKTEINDIYELNSLLIQFSSVLQQKANSIEQEIMKECAYFFEDLKDTLSLMNEKNDGYRLFKEDRFQRKLEKIKLSIQGTMANYIAKRVSLDDDACRRILRLLPGESKKRKMDEFERVVLVEAVSEVTSKIKDKITDFEEELVQVIEDRMEQIDVSAIEKEGVLLQLIESKKNNEQQNEEIVFESMLAISQSLYILDEIRMER